MTIDAMRRPAIVTDADRQWAVEQMPADWTVDAPDLPWPQHVAEQAERFEAHFGHDRKSYAEWSGLWRRVWWPKADASILHPGKAPHVAHPFVKRGDAKWDGALAVLNASERRIADRFGIVQFKPTDPRVDVLTGAQP